MVWKVPLLVELIVLGTHLWTIDKEFVDITKDLHYFVASVEFAGQQPRRLLEVGRAQKKGESTCRALPLHEQTPFLNLI